MPRVLNEVSLSISLLTQEEQRRYRWLMRFQMALGLLDLVAVLLLGLVAFAAASGGSLPARLADTFEQLGYPSGIFTAQQLLLLAVMAGGLLLLRTLGSAALLSLMTRDLGRAQARFSRQALEQALGDDRAVLDERSSQALAHACTQGSYVAVTLMLGSWAVVVSELVLLVFLVTALTIVAPWTALVAVIYFSLVALALQTYLGSRARRAGSSRRIGTVDALVGVQEAVRAYREVFVSGRLPLVVGGAAHSMTTAAKGAASEQFLVQVPKMLLEGALVVGGAVLVGWQLSRSGFADAVAILAVFVAAATRMLPSLLRMTGSVVLLRSLGEQAQPAYDLKVVPTNDLIHAAEVVLSPLMSTPACTVFEPSVEIRGVSFRYPRSTTSALSPTSLSIRPGERIALVGHSGSGKSTLADLMLGILAPCEGEILLGGLPPREAIARWQGSIAYVPQESVVFSTTVRENILPGIGEDTSHDGDIWKALKAAQLEDFVSKLPEGIATSVGEDGKLLSGGQAQRLGLARALVSEPTLLIMDEATSALDPETERAFGSALASLPGDATIITIAHRPAAIERATRILVMQAGKVIEDSSFPTEVLGRVGFSVLEAKP